MLGSAIDAGEGVLCGCSRLVRFLIALVLAPAAAAQTPGTQTAIAPSSATDGPGALCISTTLQNPVSIQGVVIP
jgi:hypothetical protein